MAPDTSATGALARTPFETAPPDVQRNVIVSAQIALARRGLYHEDVNGVYGPAMEFSLRAYQARTKLPVTGRLDLQTLAALRLLPAAARTILRSCTKTLASSARPSGSR
jgi:peptidoglycan hydrolase-like protein with peptidoglycan-binding domain